MITNSQKLKLLHTILGKPSAGDTQAVFRCPVCNETKKDKKKLVVRLDDGWYHCWVCGLAGKSYYTLVKKVAPQFLHDERFSELFGYRSSGAVTSAPEEPKVVLPENCVLVGSKEINDPDVYAVQLYLSKRGLSRLDMLRWRICATSTGQFKRKAIIPSFDAYGDLNYFVARAIDESKFKYRNATRPKTEIVFNEIDIDWTQPVTLVEGVFDAMKCPDNTIPVLGSSLPKSSELFMRLWENRCRVVVALDPDLKDNSHRICQNLSNAGLDVCQVWAPDGKDFGAMTKAEVKQILDAAQPWSRISKLHLKIRSMASGSIF